MIPTFIFTTWLSGLLSLAILATSFILGHEWYQRSWAWDETLRRSVFDPQFGMNAVTGLFAISLVLGLIGFLGRYLVKAVLKATLAKNGVDDPESNPPSPSVEEYVKRPDGSKLLVRLFGAEDAPPVILTHGWGMHSDAWNYAKRELTGHYRVIVWDEPGLGASTPPDNRDYHLENLAQNLKAVLDTYAKDRPAVLVGHSIGGMITLTFCKLFPGDLGTRVAGISLVHTTYTNPVRTTQGATLLSAIETPVLKPLMYLTIMLSPLVRLMNVLSYWNGTGHLITKQSGFAGGETWEQLDFAARFQIQATPSILARGMLGMMEYDTTDTLASINVPALVVAGDQDSTCKPEASWHMYDQIPGAELLTLQPAKHLGHLEHHEKLSAELSAFITRLQKPLVHTPDYTTTN